MSSDASKPSVPAGSDDKPNVDATKIATVVGVVVAAGIGISYLQSRRNKDKDLFDEAEDSFDDFGNKISRKADEGKRYVQRKGDEAKYQADDAKWGAYSARDRAQAESDNIGNATKEAADETKGFFKRTKAKAEDKLQDVKESAKETGSKIQGKAKEVGDKTKKALRTHPVQKGDTLYSLSRKYNVPVDTIKRANNIWGSEIRPGDSLYIPGSDGY